MSNNFCSKEFYSNCLIEAIKAKLNNPTKIKLYYIPARLNECFCPHIMWHDGEYTYDFWASGHLNPIQILWHKGVIRKSEYGYYDRVMETLLKWNNRKEKHYEQINIQ